jgi:hypothetical protein
MEERLLCKQEGAGSIPAGSIALGHCPPAEVGEIRTEAVELKIAAVGVERPPKPGPTPAAMESHGVEYSESPLQHTLKRAWGIISGG